MLAQIVDTDHDLYLGWNNNFYIDESIFLNGWNKEVIIPKLRKFVRDCILDFRAAKKEGEILFTKSKFIMGTDNLFWYEYDKDAGILEIGIESYPTAFVTKRYGEGGKKNVSIFSGTHTPQR